MQGGDFLSGAAGGFFGSLGASGFGAVAGEWASSFGGNVFFGVLSGGIGAELTGGNFWVGAVTGGIVAGFNHAMHMEKLATDSNPPEEEGWQIKIANLISGGAVDEARAILAFEKTNPSTTDRIIFNTGVSLSNAANETFLGRE